MASEYLAPNEEMVDGLYPHGALIRRSVGGAVYKTEFGEGEKLVPAVIRIREVESTEAENLRQRLLNVGQLEHPNLLTIYATGWSVLNGVPVFYVVMERADESLEAVLAERALTTSETREMLLPTLDALDYLHKNGYTHSRLRPSNVLAVNDQLKLSTDNVIQVIDHRAADAMKAEDMRAVGVLILQALALKIPNPDERLEPSGVVGVPQPLADIVRHCLDPDVANRWTVDQVKASLNAPPPIAVEVLPQSEENPEADRSKPRVPKWTYVALATLILAVILAAVVRNHDSAPVAIPVVAAAHQDSQAPTVPSQPITSPPRVEKPQAGSRAGDRKASGWSVIVGAYRSRELAEKRMRELTKTSPNFEITVFEPQGEKSTYLVVLGRNLSEDQAQALRKRAVKSRLPGDTYIKRVM